MKPCISQVTTLSTPFEEDIAALAKGGWDDVELWLTKLETYLQGRTVADASRVLAEQGVRAVAASSQGGLLARRGAEHDLHWDQFRGRLDLLAELGVPTFVITADFPAAPSGDELRSAVDSLARAAEEAKTRQVRLALEFQKTSRFCASLDTTAALVEQVASPNLGICLDLFHYYTGPSKFEDLAYLSAANLAWLQLCDLSGTPRELAGDSDRIFPGEGDFQLDPILDHIARLGYDGHASLEILNPSLWEIPADRVAFAAYQSLVRTLGERLDPEPDIALDHGED